MSGPDAVAAMNFARHAHRDQVRDHTWEPYWSHGAEVAGIVSAVAPFGSMRLMACVSFLHDVIEMTDATAEEIRRDFGPEVAQGVVALSDDPSLVGSRAFRKAASTARVAASDAWIQTVKVGDIISNTKSVLRYDPKFARVYIPEKRLQLDALVRADPRLVEIARAQLGPG